MIKRHVRDTSRSISNSEDELAKRVGRRVELGAWRGRIKKPPRTELPDQGGPNLKHASR